MVGELNYRPAGMFWRLIRDRYSVMKTILHVPIQKSWWSKIRVDQGKQLNTDTTGMRGSDKDCDKHVFKRRHALNIPRSRPGTFSIMSFCTVHLNCTWFIGCEINSERFNGLWFLVTNIFAMEFQKCRYDECGSGDTKSVVINILSCWRQQIQECRRWWGAELLGFLRLTRILRTSQTFWRSSWRMLRCVRTEGCSPCRNGLSNSSRCCFRRPITPHQVWTVQSLCFRR